MNIIFRCLLIVYAFCTTLLSVIFMLASCRVNFFEAMTAFGCGSILKGGKYILIIELVFFCVSIFFLISAFRFKKNKRIITRKSELGEIRISLDTIESIVLGTVRKIQQVKELKVYVENREDNLIILVKLITAIEANIPILVEEVQKKAKKAVEENTGLVVAEVKILVDNASSTNKARVE